MNINRDTNELMKYFNTFNYIFFKGELPEPIITIQSSCRKFTNGWFTPAETWQNEDGSVKKNEIAVIAEKLNRPQSDIAETVLHEMVHLHNYVSKVQDCNGNIHNKNFKKAAEEHGLLVEKAGKLGWAFTKFNDKAKEIFDTMEHDLEAFTLYRIPIVKPEKEKKTSYKYVCPSCKDKFTLKLQIEAVCINCGHDFDVEEKEPE